MYFIKCFEVFGICLHIFFPQFYFLLIELSKKETTCTSIFFLNFNIKKFLLIKELLLDDMIKRQFVPVLKMQAYSISENFRKP